MPVHSTQVAENAKGEDADAATSALLSAEAHHHHNDTVVAAAVSHGGPFPGFGVPHGGGGGWKRWHSSGRTHHATISGGVSGRGAQGTTAGCLGGDEAAGWGTRAALKEKFDVCAAQFPEGHGELTKAAFKALVDDMMRENDSDGNYTTTLPTNLVQISDRFILDLRIPFNRSCLNDESNEG